MFDNYNIVLFKNNKKKKLIKTYVTKNSAIKKFNSLIDKNKNIVFDKKIENAEKCDFYLAIITNQEKVQNTLFITDELGRNNVVNLESPDFDFVDIKRYKIEELIYDWQTKNKISLNKLISTYCKSTELKSIYNLNNKLCIQINEDVVIFSLKDKGDSERLLDVLESHFINNGMSDAIFIRDVSLPQRKWVYRILEEKGFDKKQLYRLKTTFSKR